MYDEEFGVREFEHFVNECRLCGTVGGTVHPCKCHLGVHVSCLLIDFQKREQWLDLTCPDCNKAYTGETAVELAEVSVENLEGSKTALDVLAEGYTNLGIACGRVGDTAKQGEYLSKSVDVWRQLLNMDPIEHVELARISDKLAKGLRGVGKHEQRREVLEGALAISETKCRAVDLVPTLTCLADTYEALGDNAKASASLARALAIEEAEFGEWYVGLLPVLTSIADLQARQKELQLQQKTLERILAITEKEHGKKHIDVAVVLTKLGLVYHALGHAIYGNSQAKNGAKFSPWRNSNTKLSTARSF
jgi:tetratricopeptide (TPR) repeat protein